MSKIEEQEEKLGAPTRRFDSVVGVFIPVVTVRVEALRCAVHSLREDLAEYDMLWEGRPTRLARRDADRAVLDELDAALRGAGG